MPDWEIMRWDENNFDVNFCPYTTAAYQQKKYAFVSDVARLYALVTHGGVYLDTDFKLFSSIEPYRDCHGFTGFEVYEEDYEEQDLPLLDDEGKPLKKGDVIPCCGLLAGVMGSEPENPFWMECLESYKSRKPESGFVIINNLISILAVEHGFRYLDRRQDLDYLTVYPSEIFACEPCRYNETTTVALHRHASHSWQSPTSRERIERWLDCHGLLRPYMLLIHIVKKPFQ